MLTRTEKILHFPCHNLLLETDCLVSLHDIPDYVVVNVCHSQNMDTNVVVIAYMYYMSCHREALKFSITRTGC